MKIKALSILVLIHTGSIAFAEGEPSKGKRVFKKCSSCHAIEEGQRKLGPSLYGIIGREAGSVEGFKYSKPMAAASFVWNDETLAGFLANPKKYMKGTKMAFPGIKKENDMANLLAYLNTLQ